MKLESKVPVAISLLERPKRQDFLKVKQKEKRKKKTVILDLYNALNTQNKAFILPEVGCPLFP